MKELRVVVIVSKDKSDLYFANQLMKSLNVVGVIVENQREERDQAPLLSKFIRHLTKPHVLIGKVSNKISNTLRAKYAVYNRPENSADFGEEGRKIFPSAQTTVIYTVGVNNINAPEYLQALTQMQPDIVAVCGASIFREKLISIPKYGVLNLHGGLAQKYRGLFTTDWAVYNEEPEYIGATVHFVTPGIDDGDVVYQGRPNIEQDDNPHSLYVKVVQLGVQMMTQAIKDLQTGNSESVPLRQKGDLYLGRMYDTRAKAATWKKIRKGVMQTYLSNKVERDKPVLAMMARVFPGSF